MKSVHAGWLIVAAVVLVAGCQAGGQPTDSGAIADVRTADNAFSAMSAKDGFAHAFHNYALEKAVFLPDNHAALTTRESIEQSLVALPAGTQLSWSPQGADASGDLGYTWGIYTLTGKSGSGQATVGYGKYLSVWKEQSGKWKLAVMMLNQSPGPMG